MMYYDYMRLLLFILFISACGSKEQTPIRCNKFFVADGRSNQVYLVPDAYDGEDIRHGFCLNQKIEE